ncbi:MAG: tRNA glutamyl-Q(34) synthetase GluQRS [Schaalia turicensis]
MEYGRYAPSPSGDLHLGNLRTALLAWALARRSGRGFLMRVEDMDERSRPQFQERQLADLRALGLTWDGPVQIQSQRIGGYDAAFASLRERGLLYECYCTRRDLADAARAPHGAPGVYPGTCRDLSAAGRRAGRAKLAAVGRQPALRLRTEVKELTIHDEVCGEVSGVVDDFVIRRGDGRYAYNFASVVDDALEHITQVTRGADLAPSTPRQVYLQRLLGAPTPEYWHVPMVLNREGARLAKRDGAVTMRALAEYGWSPADVLALIGRSLGLEVRTAADFAQQLDARALRRRGPWYVDVAALEAGPAE